MTTIRIFDVEAKEIEKLADENETSEAVIVEAIMSAIKYNDIDIKEYI